VLVLLFNLQKVQCAESLKMLLCSIPVVRPVGVTLREASTTHVTRLTDSVSARSSRGNGAVIAARQAPPS